MTAAALRTGLALVLLCGAASAAVQAGPGDRYHLAHLSLEGPLEQVRLVLEPFGASVLTGALSAGERRSVRVPFPAWGATAGLEPSVQVVGGGRATFGGWASENAAADRAWAELPRSLRQRPRPAPPARAPSRAPRSALLLVAAALAAGWALRARPWRVAGVSLLAAVAVFPLVDPGADTGAGSDAGPTRLRVLEGDGAGGAWMVVDAARERLAAPAGVPAGARGAEGLLRLECEPARARLTFDLLLTSAELPRWTVSGPGCVFHALGGADSAAELRALALEDPGPEGRRLITQGANGLAALSAAWIRPPDGSGWRAVGPWPLGAPLPATLGAEDPPGGLNPALPLGQRVLVGRVAPGAARGEVWVRLVGLP